MKTKIKTTMMRVTRRALGGGKSAGNTTWIKVMRAMAMVNCDHEEEIGQQKKYVISDKHAVYRVVRMTMMSERGQHTHAVPSFPNCFRAADN